VLSEIKIQPESRNLTISGWDLWSAVNDFLIAAEPVFLRGSIARNLGGGNIIPDELFSVMFSTWARPPPEYLDYEILANDTRRLFKAVANQIAARHFGRDLASTTAGAYRATQNRVMLLSVSLRVVEAGIMILIICAVLMVAYTVWVPYFRAGDNTAMLAVVLARSDRLGSF
jgi:hypothetical protein